MARSALQFAMARATNPLSKRAYYQQLCSALKTERQSSDSHWREISDFVRPRRQRFFTSDKNRNDRRNQNIIDSTARFASRTLASGLHSGMSSPARPWFKSTTLDPKLARLKPVQVWLEDVTTRIQAVFAASNLYNSLPVLYGDLGDFGTAAMSVLPDNKDLFRTRVFPVGSYAIGLDSRGLATTFMREYSCSVLQLIQEFGVKAGSRDIDWANISPTVKSLWDKGEYQTQIPVTWVVAPNVNADPNRAVLAKYMPWSSCYFETGSASSSASSTSYPPGQGFLREGGFKSFPIMVPRWEVTDDDSYGTGCPGMDALGDVKQLQLEHREKAKAIQKMVTPPMVGAPELRTQKTTVFPGDVTYVRDTQHGFKAAYQVQIDISALREDIADVQYRIQRAYFEDLFLMLARSDMLERDPAKTATEIAERKEEKMLALGPVLERSNDELFNPLYDRVFEMMEDAGLIPEPPDELEGAEVKPEYTSVLAQAQKLVGVNAQDRMVQTVASMAAVWPESRHKLVPNRTLDNYGQMYGTDPAILRTDEEAQQFADAEAQAAQAAQAAENAQKLGSAVKSASDAKVGTGSALDALTAGGAA